MTTITLNNINFTVTEDAGEYWFAAERSLNYQALTKAVRETMIDKEDIKWFSPRHGNFSVVGKDAEFFVKVLMVKDNFDAVLDLFFEEAQ